MNLKMEPGSLCYAYYYFLSDKCERIDNLPLYCNEVNEFQAKKLDFEAEKRAKNFCISNPPLPSDIIGIDRCVNYIIFNSTYSKLPLSLSLKSLDSNYTDSINTIFAVYNPNGLPKKLISISYDVFKNRTKVVSGDLAPNPYLCSDCVFDINPHETREFSNKQFTSPQAYNISSSKSPYLINGTYRYENSSSGIETKQFNFTSQ